MLTHESLYVFAFAIPIYQLLFYTIQLITISRTNPSRLYIGLLLLAMTTVIIFAATFHLSYHSIFFAVYPFFVPLVLMLFPLYYLYFFALTRAESTLSHTKKAMLFLPSIILLILNLFIFKPETDIIKYLSIRVADLFSATETMNPTTYFHGLTLKFLLPLLLTTQALITYLNVKSFFANENEVMQKDASHLAYLKPAYQHVILLCLLIFAAAVIFPLVFMPELGLKRAVVANLVILISGGAIGYFALKQNRLFLDVFTMNTREELAFSVTRPDKDADLTNGKSADETEQNDQSLMSKSEIRESIKRLNKLMLSEKPYLDPGFSMSDLCRHMDVDRRKMTYLLNNVLNKNFYGFINDYRMKDVIDYLEHGDKKYTIEGIAEKVGFRSKSSFYVCFKKYTGATPKEYLAKK